MKNQKGLEAETYFRNPKSILERDSTPKFGEPSTRAFKARTSRQSFSRCPRAFNTERKKNEFSMRRRPCLSYLLCVFSMKDAFQPISPLGWGQMPWSSFSECWALSQFFHSLLSLSSRGFLSLLHFLPCAYLRILIFLPAQSWFLSMVVQQLFAFLVFLQEMRAWSPTLPSLYPPDKIPWTGHKTYTCRFQQDRQPIVI